VLPFVLALALFAQAPTAAAAAERDYFADGAAALAGGKYQDAIDLLEAYADHMPPHPDASYDRGLAYVLRVRNGSERPGDLGRAAAAFEEALLLRPADDDARHALELVHGEIARRRARRGDDAVLAKPSLDRVVVRLASERTWGILAAVAAGLLAVGLVLRRRPAGSAHLAGILLVPACAVALAAFIPLYLGARHLRLETRIGVLVVREAHLTDEEGKAVGGDPIPEAARVELGERRGRLVHVLYGSVEGWLPNEAVQVLRTQ
jgi:tetratricopeptide (TPR) repeat protein